MNVNLLVGGNVKDFRLDKVFFLDVGSDLVFAIIHDFENIFVLQCHAKH